MTTNKKLILIIVFIVAVLCIYLGCAYLEEKDLPKRFELFSSFLGSLVAVIGLALGFAFLDRFETGKKVVERQFEAVVSLAECFSVMRFKFIGSDKSLIFLTPKIEKIKFFRNKEWDDIREKVLVFEMDRFFNDVSEFREKADNIWLPKEIRERCQFLIPDGLNGVHKHNALMVRIRALKSEESKRVSAEFPFGEMIDGVVKFSDLLDGFESLIKSVQTWLDNHSGLKEHVNL